MYLLASGSLKKVPRDVAVLLKELLLPRQGAPTAEEVAVVRLGSQSLVEVGFRVAVERERARRRGPGLLTEVYEDVQGRLLEAMRSDGSLRAVERAGAGDSLTLLGDPRQGVLEVEAMEFCHVGAGRFWMGSGDEDKMARDDEKPLHEIEIGYAYWVSRYPVTQAQYRAFVEAGGYKEERYWTAWGWRWREQEGLEDRDPYGGVHELSNHPVVRVSWYEAMAYCRWLTGYYREVVAPDRLASEDLTPQEHAFWVGLQLGWGDWGCTCRVRVSGRRRPVVVLTGVVIRGERRRTRTERTRMIRESALRMRWGASAEE